MTSHRLSHLSHAAVRGFRSGVGGALKANVAGGMSATFATGLTAALSTDDYRMGLAVAASSVVLHGIAEAIQHVSRAHDSFESADELERARARAIPRGADFFLPA